MTTSKRLKASQPKGWLVFFFVLAFVCMYLFFLAAGATSK
jgi:hypothetical protein